MWDRRANFARLRRCNDCEHLVSLPDGELWRRIQCEKGHKPTIDTINNVIYRDNCKDFKEGDG